MQHDSFLWMITGRNWRNVAPSRSRGSNRPKNRAKSGDPPELGPELADAWHDMCIGDVSRVFATS